MDSSQPQESCGVYGVCEAYGVCFTQANVQLCSCAEGFKPKDANAWHLGQWWLSGCVRRSPLQCSASPESIINGSGSDTATTDGFLQVGNLSLSDNEAPEYNPESLNLQECKTACFSNCSCWAFAFTDSNPAICKLLFGNLLSLHTKSKDISSERESLFVRLAASDVPKPLSNGGTTRSTLLVLSISIPLGIAVLGAMFIGVWVFIQRRRRRLLEKLKYSTSFRIFSYKELRVATNNFAHKLGKGAFGAVFKRTLTDKSLVAV